jgi:hypothetical protein
MGPQGPAGADGADGSLDELRGAAIVARFCPFGTFRRGDVVTDVNFSAGSITRISEFGTVSSIPDRLTTTTESLCEIR